MSLWTSLWSPRTTSPSPSINVDVVYFKPLLTSKTRLGSGPNRSSKLSRMVSQSTAPPSRNSRKLWSYQWEFIGLICSLDFIIDCRGPCSGKIIFTVIHIEPESTSGMEERTNPSKGDLLFETVGGGEAAIVSSDVGIVIEAGKLWSSILLLLGSSHGFRGEL